MTVDESARRPPGRRPHRRRLRHGHLHGARGRSGHARQPRARSGAMAGVWQSALGADEHPESYGTGRDAFVERYELQPIDRQTNGPQLFYGLRYHTHIVKPGEVETFHDQVGYWLWEPATHTVTLTLGIPRGQVLLAGGTAEPDATEFEVRAAVGSEVYGILSNPFLDAKFRTTSYRMHVTVHPGRDLELRGGGRARHPRARRALLPRRPQHPDPGRLPRPPTHWRCRPCPTVRSASAPSDTKAGISHEPPDARARTRHRRRVGADRGGGDPVGQALPGRPPTGRLRRAARLGIVRGRRRSGGRRWTAARWPVSRRPSAGCPRWSSSGRRSRSTGPSWPTPTGGRPTSTSTPSSPRGAPPRSPRTSSSSTATRRRDVAGIIPSSPHEKVAISDDYSAYPEHVAKAVAALRAADIAGPYAIALGARCYTGVTETTEHGGYPVLAPPAPSCSAVRSCGRRPSTARSC